MNKEKKWKTFFIISKPYTGRFYFNLNGQYKWMYKFSLPQNDIQ